MRHAEGLADLLAQLVVIPGLGQELVDGAMVDCVGHRLQVGIAGEHQADGRRVDLADAGEELGARHVRHALVGDHHLDRLLGEYLEGLGRRGGGQDGVAFAAQQAGQRTQDVRLVIDQQQRLFLRCDGHGERQQLVVAEQGGEFVRRQRAAEQVALDRVAPPAAQEAGLGLGFDAFGEDRQVEAAAHDDGGRGDGRIDRVVDDVAHEGLVDLDLVEGKARQVGERRVAGAEIVERQLDAECLQLAAHGDGFGDIVDEGALGDFQFERRGRQAALGQRGGDLGGQVGLAELAGRQVHGDMQRQQAEIEPGLGLPAGGAQHPVADLDDQAGFLGDRDELDGGHRAELGRIPAQQGLHADHVTTLQADLRLVMHAELVVGEGGAERRFDRQAAGGVGVHFRRIEVEGVAPGLLGAQQGSIGRAEHGLDGFAVLGEDADADAGRDRHRLPGYHERHRDGVQHALGEGQGVPFVAQVGHHETEFVAGPAAHGVPLAYLQLEAAGDLDQDFIAGRRAERVIDQSEAVEVEQDQRRTPLEAAGSEQRLLQAVVEQGAVGQFGQCVVARQEVDALGCRLAFRQVAEDADIVRRDAAGLAQAADREPFGDQGTVLVAIGDFALPVAVLVDGPPHLGIEGGPMDAGLEQAGRLADGFGGGVAGDLAERIIDAQDAALGIGDADALANPGEYQIGQAMFGFGLFALGDVEQGADHQRRLAGGVEFDRPAARFDPAPVAIVVTDAEFGNLDLVAALVGDQRFDGRAILRVDQVQGISQPFRLVVIAEHPAKAFAPAVAVVGMVVFPDAEAAAFQGQGQMALQLSVLGDAPVHFLFQPGFLVGE